MTGKENLLPELEFMDDDVQNVFSTSASDAPPQKQEEQRGSEEKEEKEEQHEEQTSQKVKISEEADPNIAAAYKFYVDAGIIEAEEDDEFDGTPEGLQDRLSRVVDKKAEDAIENMINPLSPVGKAIIAMALEKGASLTEKDIRDMLTELSPPQWTEEDLKDAGKAAKYMTEVFKRQGFSDDDAQDMTEVLADKGKLQTQAAQELKKELKAKSDRAGEVAEKSKESRQEVKLNEENFRKQFAQAIADTGWRKDKVDKVVGSFFQGDFRDRMNHALYGNPKALVQIIDFMNHYNPENGEFDMEAYKKDALSPSVKKVAEKMKSNYWKSSGGATHKEQNIEYDFID